MALRYTVPRRDLGGHVKWGATEAYEAWHAPLTARGLSKVDKARVGAVRRADDADVLRLHVAVRPALRVQMPQRICNLACVNACLCLRKVVLTLKQAVEIAVRRADDERALGG